MKLVAPEQTQQMRDKATDKVLERNPHLEGKPEELQRAVNEELERIRDKHGDIR